ncbi:MAG: hypothetical protein INQ03_25740 [Candidatus Heimdallarchaeota archaeon]|nr:hypothetical protein [Candidatus Heimdallarchaeota archaeon]
MLPRLPKIEDNHKKFDDNKLWTAEKLEALVTQDVWTQFTYNSQIKFTDENLEEAMKEAWQEKNRVLFVDSELADEEIRELQMQYYDEHKPKFWLPIYNKRSNQLVEPFEEMEMGLKERIMNFQKASIIRKFNSGREVEHAYNSLTGQIKPNFSQEELHKHMRQKEGKIDAWKEKLTKANQWDEDEEILDAGIGTLRRSNWKVRSNLSGRGRVVFTNKRMIFVKKKFSLFNPMVFLPLVAFVRPSNKVIMFFKMISEYIKVIFQVFKPFLSNAWTYIAALSIALPNIDLILPKLELWAIDFPVIHWITISLRFAIENPVVIPTIAGAFPVIQASFIRFFMRSEQIIVVPYDTIQTLQLDRKMIITRLKLKGTKLFGVDHIEFKMMLRAKKHKEFAQDMYGTLLKVLGTGNPIQENVE